METTLTEKAMQLVIMDAINNGHTDKDELIKYMASQAFKTSVKGYVDMFKAEFAKIKENDMEKFNCTICGQETEFLDDLCEDCGDQWFQYHAECKTFGINPTRDGFIEAGNDPKIWDHLI